MPRLLRSPGSQRCYECRERADVIVARGNRYWYACWEHASALLEHGGVLLGGELE